MGMREQLVKLPGRLVRRFLFLPVLLLCAVSFELPVSHSRSEDQSVVIHGRVVVQHTLSRFCIAGVEQLPRESSQHVLAVLPSSSAPPESLRGQHRGACSTSFVGKEISWKGSYREERRTGDNIDIANLYGALRYSLFQERRLSRSDELPETIPYFSVSEFLPDEAP